MRDKAPFFLVDVKTQFEQQIECVPPGQTILKSLSGTVQVGELLPCFGKRTRCNWEAKSVRIMRWWGSHAIRLSRSLTSSEGGTINADSSISTILNINRKKWQGERHSIYMVDHIRIIRRLLCGVPGTFSSIRACEWTTSMCPKKFNYRIAQMVLVIVDLVSNRMTNIASNLMKFTSGNP